MIVFVVPPPRCLFIFLISVLLLFLTRYFVPFFVFCLRLLYLFFVICKQSVVLAPQPFMLLLFLVRYFVPFVFGGGFCTFFCHMQRRRCLAPKTVCISPPQAVVSTCAVFDTLSPAPPYASAGFPKLDFFCENPRRG